MKRRFTLFLAALGLSLALAAPVAAAGPTCSEMGMANHGEHVLGLYVVGGSLALGYWAPTGGVGQFIAGEGADLPGGPGPAFHFEEGFQPGASFCNEGAQSPTSPPGR
jgi:hypothetical protein